MNKKIYKLVNKKIINGKKRSIYKKKGSSKEFLKNKGVMMNVVRYIKKIKKGGMKDKGRWSKLTIQTNPNPYIKLLSQKNSQNAKKAKKIMEYEIRAANNR